jgi:hypothetical protein
VTDIRKKSPIGSLFSEKLPQYADFLVPEEPRSRTETEFLNGIIREVSDRLKGRGIRCNAATPTVTNNGYRLLLTDRENRPFYCGFTYDEGIALGQQYGEHGMFQRVVDLCCERALDALKPPPAEAHEAAPRGTVIH